MTVLTVLAVFGGYGSFGRDGYPLKLTPFSVILNFERIREEPRTLLWKCKVPIFLRVWSFVSHALYILSADDSGQFLQNPREVSQIVGGQNVQSMRDKRSDPRKDQNFPFSRTSTKIPEGHHPRGTTLREAL